MPGVIVRMVTISNFNLALPLALLTVSELWVAWEGGAPRRLLWCGLLVGLGILTDLYLVELVPVYLLVALSIWRRSPGWPAVRWTAAGGVAAAVVVAPWLAFNEAKYHAATASALSKSEQMSIVNPHHLHYSIGQLPGLTMTTLFQPVLPQEWGGWLYHHNVLSYLTVVFQIVVVLGSVAVVLLMGRKGMSQGLWVLALPWVCNILLCWYIDVGQQWQSGAMLGRYTYPTLAQLALAGMAALMGLTDRLRPILLIVTLGCIYLIGLWIHLVPMIHLS
jgi:hypothetical protein